MNGNRAKLRERFWVWVASFATRQANRAAPPFHGDPRPYWLMAPDRRPDDAPAEVWWNA